MFLSLFAVGFVWGITNPFLKIGTQGVEKVHDPNKCKKILKELTYLVTNWKYILPFLVNQCGSLLYVYTLPHADLTLAVPISNSLSFVFTFIGGWIVGEKAPNTRTLLGMGLVSAGIGCYVLDRLSRDSKGL